MIRVIKNGLERKIKEEQLEYFISKGYKALSKAEAAPAAEEVIHADKKHGKK